MLLRYGPFASIWLLGAAFLIWMIMSPKVADPRYWQVEGVEVKLGSTAVFNQYDESKKTMGDAAVSGTAHDTQQPQAEDPGLQPLASLPDDGIRINALNPELQEEGTHGPIPKTSGDRAPWEYYARPFQQDGRPRIAIVIKDMGLSEAGLKDGLATLPGAVTFAFSPYADNLTAAMQAARDRGHETLLQLPLEVPPGVTMDVGTEAISSAQTAAVNKDNLFRLLAKMVGSVGVITDGGQRLVNNESMLKPLMENIHGRGLLMIDDTQQNETLSPLFAEQLQMPWARSLMHIDAALSRNAMDAAMQKAVQLAKENGSAIVVAGPSPLARSVIAAWAGKLEREGIALAPVSAVVTKGSAGQISVPQQTETPSTISGTADGEDDAEDAPAAEEPDSGPVNLLNPGAPAAGAVPNILDPAKSAPAAASAAH